MIHNLNGIYETVDYLADSQICLYYNTEYENYPPHWHNSFEVIMPVKNTYEVLCGGVRYKLREGDVLIISPGMIHELFAPETGERIIFQPGMGKISLKEVNLLISLISPAVLVTPEEYPYVYEQIQENLFKIKNEYFSYAPYAETLIFSKLMEILVLIGRNYEANVRRNMTPVTSHQKEYMEKFLFVTGYIEEHFAEDLTLEQMGFTTTEDTAGADAIIGGCDLDEESLAAVQAGVPYVGYSENAVEVIQESLLPDVQTGYTDGVDCLGYVTYPEETLVNASYIQDGDDVFYGVGTSYFTALPEGAKVLVQRDGSRAPLEGNLTGDEESMNAFLNGIMGFSYAGKDIAGNDVNITLFANSMTEGGHQRDEYAFISNALFSAFLTETPYVTE